MNSFTPHINNRDNLRERLSHNEITGGTKYSSSFLGGNKKFELQEVKIFPKTEIEGRTISRGVVRTRTLERKLKSFLRVEI